MASSSYQQRIQRGMAKYLAEHPNASAAEAKRAARGHGATGEHGVTVRDLGGKEFAVIFRDPAKAQQAIRAVAREIKARGLSASATQKEPRVTVAAIGKDGKPVELFENKGHSKGMTFKEMNTQARKGGGWEAFVTSAMEKYQPRYDEDEPDDDYDEEMDEEELEEQEEELLAGIREYQLIVQ